MGDKPLRAQEINFKVDPGAQCEVENCTRTTDIQRSHCGRQLCYKHFLERICFHDASEDMDDELIYEEELPRTATPTPDGTGFDRGPR